MATLPVPPNPNDLSRKRGRDPNEVSSGDPPSKRSATATPAAGDVIFRVVLPPKQIGRVIGKQGARIQQVRALTGATVRIVDASNPLEERVIVISSNNVDNGISSAETALYSIAKLIFKDGEASNVIRLLICGSQVGCLIGTSGQNIEELRNSSGAAVNVLAQNQLPTCASANETDRILQVSGNVPQVLVALEKIGCKLRENPPKEIISIKPRYNYGLAVSNPSPYLPLPPYLPPSIPPPHYLPPSVPPSPYFPPYVPPLTYMPPSVPPPSYLPTMQPSSVDHVTSEMMIMEKLVGGLIGRNGYNISKMRIDSGATIKVSGSKGEGEQRLIQFEGSNLQVTLARSMVESNIFSQLQPQNPS